MTDIEKTELEIIAPKMLCLLCVTKKCVGRNECTTLKKWVERQIEECEKN